MREALGTNIAIATGRHYRGLPVTIGQDVYLFDLLNLLRPSNRVLVGFEIDGAGLLEILEDNIRQQNSFDGDMLHLAGRFGKINYEELKLTNITAAWRYIDKHNGTINAQLDGRVRDVTNKR